MKIVMLIGQSDFAKIVYNRLKLTNDISYVIREIPKNKKSILKFRLKKFGMIKFIGQILFILYSKLLRILSKKRISNIKNIFKLDTCSIDNKLLFTTNSINTSKVEEKLKEIDYDIVIVVGTGIIKKNILSLINKPIINVHVGITPKYRGVHGAYWALVNNDSENCGVTIHFIDEGIDTGKVISQQNISITKDDNFTTYPFLQFAEALPLLENAINEIKNNRLIESLPRNIESKQWFHPTIYTYLINRFKGIK